MDHDFDSFKDLQQAEIDEKFLMQPKVFTKSRNLHVNNYVVPQGNRALLLVDAFLKDNPENSPVHENRLIELVYGDRLPVNASIPLYKSIKECLHKLIGRTRNSLNEIMNHSENDIWIKWFVEEPSGKQWSLYQITDK